MSCDNENENASAGGDDIFSQAIGIDIPKPGIERDPDFEPNTTVAPLVASEVTKARNWIFPAIVLILAVALYYSWKVTK